MTHCGRSPRGRSTKISRHQLPARQVELMGLQTSLLRNNFKKIPREFVSHTYSRSTKNLALGRHRKCVQYVPGFLQARLKVSHVSQKNPQTHFCAQ